MALSKKEQDAIIVSKAMRAASKRRTATKIIVIVLLVSLFVSGGAWGVISFIEANSMMISISNAKEGLTLATTPDFADRTSKLKMGGPDEMDAYTYEYFNMSKDIIGHNGAHHGDKYICYSFYLMNVSPTTACEYTIGIKFTKDQKNISSAVRIMLIESDEGCVNETESIRVFAKAKEDGTAECIAYDDCKENQTPKFLEQLNGEDSYLTTNMTEPFVGDLLKAGTDEDLGYFAMREGGKRLSHNAYKKYTIVIWLEGTDQQCVNNILGGRCAIQIEFTLDKMLEVEDYGNI